ncbi:uncharacterized protein LOC110722353 [Chenopodium quinoa]|uniref:uncharacterized protein LOC110722353 n=1 Tax=Chenopodium quinoa TaxID=63459 RepID=UPI000B77987A|nr:uncharacterized protein LOC110722353 [Chenopodium quinoa]
MDFKIHEDGSLRYKGRWCVPQKCEEVKGKLMEEGHNTPYSVHPGGDKLYKDLKKVYWWPRMKNEIMEFVSVSNLSESEDRTQKTSKSGNDTIWVVVDRLTKSAVVLPMKDTWKMEQLAKAYIKNVVRLHGVTKDIVSDRDSRFLSSYHASIGMAPFEALYGRKCRSPICWNDISETMILGPQMIEDTVRKLRRYIPDKSHVLQLETIELDQSLTYKERPVKILDSKVRSTRNKEVKIVKVLWSNQEYEEATWEAEDEMKKKYPELFKDVLCLGTDAVVAVIFCGYVPEELLLWIGTTQQANDDDVCLALTGFRE